MHHKNKKKYDDFIPKSDAEAAGWLLGHATKFPEAAEVLLPGLSPSDKTTYLQEIHEWRHAIHDVDRLKKELAAAVKHKDLLRKHTGKKIRDMMIRAKRSITTNKSLLALLDALYKSKEIDIRAIKPKLKVSVVEGIVRLSFRKEHRFSITMYSRQPGGEWYHIGSDFESPFMDKRPLADPTKPEEREYMARFNNLREDIGLQSDIVRAVIGTSTDFQ